MSGIGRLINDAFSARISSQGEREKIAELGGTYVRDRLREVSFARQIVPPQQVTRTDCQRSVNHDTLVKIVDVEPKSRAMSMTFRGQPTANFIRGDKAEVGFFTVSSQMFQKVEQELLAYEMPITKIIEENSVKDMQEIEDREFLLHCEAAVQALQVEANGGTSTALNSTTIGLGTVIEFSIRKGELARAAGTADATVRPVQKSDFISGFKMLDGNRLKCERFLITEVDHDDMLNLTLEDWGSQLATETYLDGYKHNAVMGRAFTRTVKTDILRPGNLYFYTSPDFFGRFYILNNTKFYIDKIANLITFQAWEDVAISCINIAAVRKMELYSGDANPVTNANSLLTNFIPVTEDNLGAQNNRVGSGLVFPQVNQY